MNTELILKEGEFYNTYFKKDCGICGKIRLCYGIFGNNKIRGYVCRNCKDKIK